MADDQLITQSVAEMKPYVFPLLNKQDRIACDGAVLAGEPYEALAWFFSSFTVQDARKIPDDTLFSAFNLLDDEDRELYLHLLLQRQTVAI
ncbi:hypothetical protein [Bifidobacterium bombi]|uniref:Uncharacterized protein n=1 Tax=Bifidobacterium bombi DSM 19703 TaxID=1341695 RepID=A0A080N2M8_9BIFI|nr:hypothetical protein [Bifidobacterium bombi]KFF31263.1 hypothetical protein BBOMB_0603 [Bifidobacterium bombi DSM 19703]